MITHSIRAATHDDLQRMKAISVAAGMFTIEETGFFDEMVAGYLDASLEGHQWLVIESDTEEINGAAQFAPEPYADRMWNLYFIAIDPPHQGTGLGTALMHHVETDLRQRGVDEARTLIVETSSTEQYAQARAFYAGLGFDEEARIREFYGPGDHNVIFWKSLV